MNSPLQPLDRRLLRNRRGARALAATLAAYALGLTWTIVVLVFGLPWAARQRESCLI